MLKGKHIIVGVTGSIAAYKAAALVRLLVKQGAEVRVIMTPLAKEFITPLTMATLSKHPILVEFFNPENGEWNSHVSLGEWADALLIAPATANTIAAMAGGIANNLLLTTYLSARCPVMVAPAMDLDMYAHPATQRNIEALRQVGNHIIEPSEGELASGLSGKGRMAEPEDIAAFVEGFFQKKKSLEGKRVLVTAGATVEPIDPVRFISNHSTGRMGCAIARELSDRGAEVVLVCGRMSVAVPSGVEVVKAGSAEEMHRAAMELFNGCDAGVMCAAVADYTPAEVASSKIKKEGEDMSVVLRKTPDIAASLGAVKGGRLLVGFALETDNGEANASAKLAKKNLDFIVLNGVGEGVGFASETNKITIIDNRGGKREYPLKGKDSVAVDVVDRMVEYMSGNA